MTKVASIEQDQKNTQYWYTSLLIAGLFVLPFIVYAGIANHYFINVPYLDDFSVVLHPINMALKS